LQLPRAAAVALAALVALALLACQRLEDRLLGRAAARAVQPDRSEWLEDGALHVILCGTGSPLPSADRAGPCTAVIAGGHFLLVDVGPGSNANLGMWRLPRARLDGVLLTHFHSDHIGELGETALLSWAFGRSEPLVVHGPPGVDRVVSGFEEAYKLDAGYRVAHHGAEVMPPGASALHAHTVAAPATGGAAVVLEADGLRVQAFAVDHDPVRPAYGYRFDYAGRSVVVSGDTRKSRNLVANAEGVDLLVHEALAAQVVRAARDANSAAGQARRAKILDDVIGYHTTPVEAGEIAAETGAGLLVLTHLVPPPDNPILRRLFLRGVADAWDGDVVLGSDGLHFVLAPGTRDIARESLE
jgi:ribonuclease Z